MPWIERDGERELERLLLEWGKSRSKLDWWSWIYITVQFYLLFPLNCCQILKSTHFINWDHDRLREMWHHLIRIKSDVLNKHKASSPWKCIFHWQLQAIIYLAANWLAYFSTKWLIHKTIFIYICYLQVCCERML